MPFSNLGNKLIFLNEQICLKEELSHVEIQLIGRSLSSNILSAKNKTMILEYILKNLIEVSQGKDKDINEYNQKVKPFLMSVLSILNY
jgi:hypothetical protein